MRDTTFIIQIPKLREGKNPYQWKLDGAYFDARPHSLIRDGQLEVNLEVEKNGQVLDFKFNMIGQIRYSCDRCTELIYIPVHNQTGLIVKLTEEGGQSDDQVIFLGKHDNEVDVEELVYDLIHTSLPMKVTCEIEGAEKACNEDILKALDKNTNPAEETDERWEALKKLKNKN